MTLKQSFLPVVLKSGSIPGLLAIPYTEFVGNETSKALTVGTAPIKKFTLPTTYIRRRQPEYMGAQWTHAEDKKRAYMQFHEFIPIEKIMPSFNWEQNSITNKKTFNPGVMLNALINGFISQIGAPIVPPTILSVPDAQLSLQVNAEFANVPGRTFFDFNWVELFGAQYPNRNPASILITAQPSEGDLKAYLMLGGQTIAGTLTANIIRVVKTKTGNLVPGTRDFTFRIYDTSDSVDAMKAATLTPATTGGSLGDATYKYRVSAIIDGRESIASAEVSTVVNSGTGTNKNTLVWPAIANATGYYVYGRSGGTLKRLKTLGEVTTYVDTGDDSVGTADFLTQSYVDASLTVTVF